VILDRDYRPNEVCEEVTTSFAEVGVHGHIWSRKELESYLLTPSVVARISGAPETLIIEYLDKFTLQMESEVFGRLLFERTQADSRQTVSIAATFKSEFDSRWSDPQYRMETCPPKQLISALNGTLQAEGYKAVSHAMLARSHRKVEISNEVIGLLELIESRVAMHS
jgi:hypothetical protein